MQKVSLQTVQEIPLKLTFIPTDTKHIGFISKIPISAIKPR